MKKFLSILAAILMLCSCAPSAPKTEFVEGITSPPAVEIFYGDVSVNATKGTYSWQYDNGDGTQTAVEADSFHPTEFEEIACFAAGTERTAELVFDESMISYELYRWKVGKDYLYDGIGEDFEIGPEEKVPSEDGVFKVPEDGNIYIYELYVKYKRKLLLRFQNRTFRRLGNNPFGKKCYPHRSHNCFQPVRRKSNRRTYDRKLLPP